jgi:hypothetical protein
MTALIEIAILFARRDSIYKTLPGCDVWDIDRNALLWPGGAPVVAHPPCRLWGRLRHFANVVPGEKELAPWAVDRVREVGGVLEHPYKSTLWKEMELPSPKDGTDKHGGWTLAAPQFWWGHKANKATWFYIVGCSPRNLPPIPFRLGEAEFVVQSGKRENHKPHISKAEREHTPILLASWLCEVARKTTNSSSNGAWRNRRQGSELRLHKQPL